MKKIIWAFWLANISVWQSPVAEAKQVHYLARSPRALLMGDAFTARADDEYSFFYNPAAIGRNKGLEFYLLNPNIQLTNPLEYMDKFTNLPSGDVTKITQQLMGVPIYLSLGGFPTIKFGPFAMTAFATATTQIMLRNAIHPVFNIDYYYDRGFIFGYAYTFGKSMFAKNSGPTSGHSTTVGIAVKRVHRDALSGSFHLLGPTILNRISQENDLQDMMKSLGYGKGQAWGGDVGIEHSYRTSLWELSFGFSILDVNDTSYTKLAGFNQVPDQEMKINTGVTWRQDFLLFDYSINFDLHPLLTNVTFIRQTHFGVDVGIPFIRALAGYNEGYLSYGLAFRFWPIQVFAGFYSVELGVDTKQEASSNMLVYLSLFDFKFGI